MVRFYLLQAVKSIVAQSREQPTLLTKLDLAKGIKMLPENYFLFSVCVVYGRP